MMLGPDSITSKYLTVLESLLQYKDIKFLTIEENFKEKTTVGFLDIHSKIDEDLVHELLLQLQIMPYQFRTSYSNINGHALVLSD